MTTDALNGDSSEFWTTGNVRNLPKWRVKSTREKEWNGSDREATEKREQKRIVVGRRENENCSRGLQADLVKARVRWLCSKCSFQHYARYCLLSNSLFLERPILLLCINRISRWNHFRLFDLMEQIYRIYLFIFFFL